MNERLFGIDTSQLKLKAPKIEELEAEMQRTFGVHGFNSSFNFSLTND